MELTRDEIEIIIEAFEYIDDVGGLKTEELELMEKLQNA